MFIEWMTTESQNKLCIDRLYMEKENEDNQERTGKQQFWMI